MALRNLPRARAYRAWTPMLTPVANITSASVLNAFATFDGDVVSAAAAVNIQASSSGGYQLGLSLPIGTNLAAAAQLIGAGGVVLSGGFAGVVFGDPVLNRAVFNSANPNTIEVFPITLWFSYRAIG